MVGGAVRNALLGEPIGDIDLATTAVPDEVIRRVSGRGLQAGADRHRARHRDGGDRRPAVRGDDVARGRRDVRPPRQCALRPRLAEGRRAARLHHERAVGDARRHGARLLSAGSTISRCGACASSARRPRASPRITCAFCASSAFTPPTATARRTARACRPASPAAPGLRNCRASGCGWRLLKLLLAKYAGAGARDHVGRGPAVAGAGRRCRSRGFERMVKIEAAQRAFARSGAPARRACGADPRGRRSAAAAAQAFQRRARAAAVHGRGLVADFAGARARRARAALSGGTAALSRPRADGLGAFARRRMGQRPGPRSARCRSTGSCRCFRSRRPSSSPAACRTVRRSASRCGSLKRRGSRRTFRAIRRRWRGLRRLRRWRRRRRRFSRREAEELPRVRRSPARRPAAFPSRPLPRLGRRRHARFRRCASDRARGRR